MNKTRRRFLAGLLCMALVFADVMPTGMVTQAAEISQQTFVEMGGGNVTTPEEADSTYLEGASDEGDGEPETSEDQKDEESGGSGPSENQKDEGNGEPESSEDQKGEENGEQKPSEDQKDTEGGETGEETETPEEENPDEEPEAPAISLPEGDEVEGIEDAEIAALLSADETIIAEGTYTKNGSNTKWVIDGNGKLTVTGTGNVKDSGAYAYAPWYNNNVDIKTAVIEVSGMKDASRLFYGCGSLTKLDLSSFDTGQVTNMSEMFFDCDGLTDLDLSGLDTHAVTDMSGMFHHCDNLTDLNLSGFDISSVTDMSEMFSQCISLIELDLSSFGESSALDVEEMFYNCRNLRKLDLSSFDTGSVKNMHRMFYGCSRLKDLDVSGFDTGSATDMSQMFAGCSSLTKLDLGRWNIGKLDYAEYMLDGCDSLAVIDAPLHLTISVALPTGGSSEGWHREDSVETLEELPRNLEESVRLTRNKEEVEHRGTYPEDPTDDSYTEWVIDGDGKLTVTGTGEVKGSDYAPWYPYRSEIRTAVIEVKGMKDASRLFYGCDRLDSVDLSGFDTSSVTNMRMMFYGCSDLRDLDLRKFNTDLVTDMRQMFYDCSLLRTLDLSGLDAGSVEDMRGMFYGCSNLRTLDLSGLDAHSVTDMSQMFNGCSRLTSVNLSGLDAGSVPDMSGMFSGCSSLVTLDLSNLDAHSVTDMSDMFGDCRSLTTLDVSGLKIGSVENMSIMFYGCSSLAELDLNDLDTGSVTDMSFMFYGCSSLAELDLSGLDTGSVTDMSDMFHGCSSLVSLDLSGLDTGSVTNMIGMFHGCSSLVSLDLSGLDTGSVTDMDSMFSDCSSLTELDLSGLDTGSVTDMRNMFYNCGVTTLDLRNLDIRSVTNMDGMFMNCSSLTKLDLRNWKMGNVGSAVFMLDGCSSLELIYAPLNLEVSVDFPQGTMWYEGTEHRYSVPELPKGLEHSVLLIKIMPGYAIHGGLYTEGGSDIDWFIDKDGKLTVTGKGDVRASGEPVPWIGKDFSGDIRTAVIEVTGMKDASGLFKECTYLESVDLSGFETDQITDMSEMFYNCGSLTTLDVSGFETGLVTDMSYMFSGCGSLTELDLSSLDTHSVTDMSYMFDRCAGLTSLNLSGLDTHSVTDMDSMFDRCSSLTKLDLSGFKTGSVTNMHDMFSNCVSLAEVDVSGFDTRAVTNMNRVFDVCSSLTELDLRDWDMGSVTDTVNMLFACNSLETIYAPLNLQISVDLPTERSSDAWYRGGTKLTQLPLNLSASVLLTKNHKAESGSISAKKGRKDYLCGELVEIGDLTVTYRRSDGSITKLTEGDYQTPNLSDINKDTNTPGKKELKITYTDPEGGAELSTTVELTFRIGLDGENTTTTITLSGKNPVYNGYPQSPKLAVTVVMDGTSRALLEGADYTAAYANNINAGDDAVVAIEGLGDYAGKAEANFTIDRAGLIVQAADITLAVGDTMPADQDFLREAIGLVDKDEERLKVTASFIGQDSEEAVRREDVNTYKEGIYTVTLEADAGDNYEVAESREGRLVVAAERVAYTVTFDLMGHGTNVEMPGILAGRLIVTPVSLNEGDIVTEEVFSGGNGEAKETRTYVLAGWYKDKTFAAKMKWNFDADTVQEDTTLYACWVEKAAADGSGLQMSIQDIQPQYYTGSAIKPTVNVYAADGVTLLKSGRDYTITYKNNINAMPVGEDGEPIDKGGTASFTNFNKAGETKNGDIGEGTFNRDLPYVIITGKGNYQNTICKNFRILPADISADDGSGSKIPAAGFTMKYSDQLVTNAKKDQNPFSSLKYKKAMKLGTDYEITLTAGDDVRCAEGVEPAEWITKKESKGTDYDEARKKATAPAIPKGYYGTFMMTVRGKGNYAGSFAKTVVVTDKDHLLKNAKITLGKNQKSMPYDDGKAVTLTPGWCDDQDMKYYYKAAAGAIGERVSDASDIFTVKAGKTYLIEGKDYIISYVNNKAVGTAAMTITGMGDYMGTKSVTFKITGTPFNTRIVSVRPYDPELQDSHWWNQSAFMPSMTYTGRAITQNNVLLTTDNEENVLSYGKHYTISYKNNIKKGTATMTFTARPESGYAGSFKKTFKITAVDISKYKNIEVEAVTDGGHEQDSIDGIQKDTYGDGIAAYFLSGTVAYTREGAKPSAHIRIRLTGGEGDAPEAGIILKEGADYTISCVNNKVVGGINVITGPAMTVKGKGNCTGSLKVFYTIGEAALENNGNIAVSTAATVYNPGKPDGYEYQPKVIVKDGKKTLSANKDYEVRWVNNTQSAIEDYLKELEGLAGLEESARVEKWKEIEGKRPYAVITAKAESGYTSTEGITADLTIYGTKLTNNNLYVVVSEDNLQTTYTGAQVTPAVTVYYGEDAAKVKEAKKASVTDVIKNPAGYGLTELKQKTDTEEGTSTGGDYIVTYGANIAAGKNKGSVTITGASMKYGGSVTVKFEIKKRDVYHVSYNIP